MNNLLVENERLKTLLKIREAAYDMDNESGKEIERLAEQNAAMQDAFEQVCDVFRNIQFVTGGDPKRYPIYAAATEGLRLAEPHCKPHEPYVAVSTCTFRKTGV